MAEEDDDDNFPEEEETTSPLVNCHITMENHNF